MEARRPDSVRVSGYGAMLRRRWWVLALAAVVGLLFAVVVPVLKTELYVATGAVLVLSTEVVSGDVGRTGGEIDMDAEARLLKSVNVATRAKALLKVPDEPRELAANVSVAVPPNTTVLNISYSAPTAEDAQRGARAFAVAYLDYRAAVATAGLKRETATLKAQVATLRKHLQQVTRKKAALPVASPERAYLDAQERVLIDQITKLSGHVARIDSALAAPMVPGRLINNPKLREGD